MAKLLRFRSGLLVHALCILAAQSASAQILLDKLTACEDIERVYNSLRAQPTVSLSDCRPPPVSALWPEPDAPLAPRDPPRWATS
jgi:hypothetical protein